MPNPVVVFEVVRHVAQEGIPRVPLRHHQMRGQCGFGGAHRPDMQVVHRFHTGKRGKIGAHIGFRDAAWDRQHAHRDTVLQ